MRLSVGLATTLDSPEHARIAEDLGYQRAWFYDTPQQSPDVWMCLALAAQRTQRIGLGPGVLVPSLRHPMVNATATAALARLAPGRVAVGFGTGFSARRAMGQPKPIPWAYMVRYIGVFRSLLRGEVVEWEGGAMRMLATDPSGSQQPLEVPVYVGALGPKGLQIAHELADGLFVTGEVPDLEGFADVACLVWGTVLNQDEAPTAERVRRAVGPGLVLAMHGAHVAGRVDVIERLPGGREWLEVIRRGPAEHQHLTVHEGHCLYLNQADSAAWDAGAHDLVPSLTLTGSPDVIRRKVEEYAAMGVTELVYQPVGDIPQELQAMYSACASIAD
jgi:5,10-methylenetetrahydromethanopterin reductase